MDRVKEDKDEFMGQLRIALSETLKVSNDDMMGQMKSILDSFLKKIEDEMKTQQSLVSSSSMYCVLYFRKSLSPP